MTRSLAVQIVTWNSGSVLGACLDSLARQTTRDFTVVLVDNASADDTLGVIEQARERIEDLRVVGLPTNSGFSGGHNRALVETSSPFVLLLNPDTVLPDDFVARAVAAMEAAPPEVGTLAPRVIGADDRIDSTGLYLDRLRRARDRDQGLPAAAVTRPAGDVFGCTGAVALHRRSMLDDVAIDGEVLSEQLFAYYDDVDLSWRARLRGWTCHYEPALEAWHGRAARNRLRGARTRRRVDEQVLSVRNRWLTMVRCEPASGLIRDVPLLVAFEVVQCLYLLARAPRALRVYGSLARDLGPALAARRIVRARTRSHRVPPMPWRVPRRMESRQ